MPTKEEIQKELASILIEKNIFSLTSSQLESKMIQVYGKDLNFVNYNSNGNEADEDDILKLLIDDNLSSNEEKELVNGLNGESITCETVLKDLCRQGYIKAGTYMLTVYL